MGSEFWPTGSNVKQPYVFDPDWQTNGKPAYAPLQLVRGTVVAAETKKKEGHEMQLVKISSVIVSNGRSEIVEHKRVYVIPIAQPFEIGDVIRIGAIGLDPSTIDQRIEVPVDFVSGTRLLTGNDIEDLDSEGKYTIKKLELLRAEGLPRIRHLQSYHSQAVDCLDLEDYRAAMNPIFKARIDAIALPREPRPAGEGQGQSSYLELPHFTCEVDSIAQTTKEHGGLMRLLRISPITDDGISPLEGFAFAVPHGLNVQRGDRAVMYIRGFRDSERLPGSLQFLVDAMIAYRGDGLQRERVVNYCSPELLMLNASGLQVIETEDEPQDK